MARPLNLRNIDLNLLPILDALLIEECVTRASKRVHLSQSATSSALKRLRDTFDDPILVRHGQHMKPSPKARAIRDELREHLDSLAAVISSMAPLDLAESGAEISLSAPEYVLNTMSKLVRRVLSNKARSVKLKVIQFSRNTVREQLTSGDVKLAIGAFGRLNSTFSRHPLYREELIVSMRPEHPALKTAQQGRITLEDFTKYPHLVISGDDVLEDVWISKMLNIRGIQRNVDAVIPNLTIGPTILCSTDLICISTKRSTKFISKKNELAILSPPRELGVDDYIVELVWSNHQNDDPMLSWVRDEIISAVKGMKASSAAIG
jgi:DNA-binding transcriptional LysR family regulator